MDFMKKVIKNIPHNLRYGKLSKAVDHIYD